MNFFDPSSFRWDEAPLNAWYYPITAVCVYLFLINYLEKRAERKPLSPRFESIIKSCQAYHNLGISLASLIMVVGCGATVLKVGLFENNEEYGDHAGLGWLFCEQTPGIAKGKVFFWVYIFYLTKYWELLDTILQMTKGRRPPSYYFHVWHHTVYLEICWFYCHHRSSLALLAVMINGTVHICMYYYYYLVCCNKTVWWKRYITKIQIVQFLIGYACLLATFYRRFVERLPCKGETVLIFHSAFNLTMLLGFLRILGRITKDTKSSTKSISREGDTSSTSKLIKAE